MTYCINMQKIDKVYSLFFFIVSFVLRQVKERKKEKNNLPLIDDDDNVWYCVHKN